MAYLNKKTRDLIERMEDEFTLPSRWYDFLYYHEKKHNLILRTKDSYYCTNCQQTFAITKKAPKIKDRYVCPCCKGKYEVRSGRLKNWKEKDNLLILDNVDGELIVRIFEMETIFNAEKQEMDHDTVEYARKIVDDEYREIRNERVSIAQCGPFVLHWKEEAGKWRAYDGYYYESVPHGYLYIDNLKDVLKGTRYEHSRIWEYAEKNKDSYTDMRNLLSVAKHDSFETLVELKLYKLAEDARQFVCKGSFNKIFGIDKTYYEFMKKHNIDYQLLRVLQQYQTKDIRKLKFLSRYQDVIREIKQYTTIDNFIKYFRKNKLKDGHMYRDYLRFVKELGLDLKNKKYLFPDNLKQKHDEYEKQIEILKQEKLTKKIEERIEMLNKNTFKDNYFIVFPAASVQAMVDESKQQNNCVRTYAERYADGECDIYFMRCVNEQEISLVTVEVRENKVIQKRTKNNNKTTEQQDKFLNMWERKVLRKIAT